MATQAGRPMALTTPLGDKKLLIQSFHGEEMVSALFKFTIDCVGKPTEVFDFDKLLGKAVGVKLFAPDGSSVVRNFHGHVRSITQGESDQDNTHYSLEIVPQVWMLTKSAQSRIFQQVTVTAILKDVLTGFDIRVDADDSKLKPRDYCVQYRETDWNFVSRLMEEEGMFYFFEFGDNTHKLVITSPGKAKDVPHNANIIYKNVQHAAAQNQEFIYQFDKTQEITAGKVVLWDHCFEDPDKNFESIAKVSASVTQGGVTHKLNAANEKTELYDYPGEFAQRFDGVDPGGGERPADVANIPPDGARTVEIRAQAESCTGVWGTGSSTCGQLTPGHKFTLATVDRDVMTAPIKAPGDYLVLSVNHSARMQDTFRTSSSGSPFIYQNSFEVIANSAPYRPPQYTPKPIVPGSQTATVVGPTGQEIFTDKYGRVKVQFHWDRKGKKDASSSCWLRVGTPWAGRNWGMFHLPRIGQEVIVQFMEGDPDQPIIVGSVYNRDQMPAYKQPDNKTKSWVKSNSTLGGEGYNEIRFEDLKGSEQIYIHGERNYDKRIRNESMVIINNHSHMIVGGKDVTADKDMKADYREKIYQDKHLHVMRHQEEHIEGSYKLTVGYPTGDEKPPNPGNLSIVLEANRHETVGGESHLHVGKDRLNLIDGEDHLHVKSHKTTTIDGVDCFKSYSQFVYCDEGMNIQCNNQEIETKADLMRRVGGDALYQVTGNVGTQANADVNIKAGGKIVLEATQISLKVGGNFVDISSSGVAIKGSMVLINSGGSAASATNVSVNSIGPPSDVKDAKDAAKAKPTDPTVADKSVTGKKSAPS